MDTIIISKKEYRELKAAKARLEILSNMRGKKYGGVTRRTRLDDLVGLLSDVEMFKDKSSVEVQHMIPEIWSKKYRT